MGLAMLHSPLGVRGTTGLIAPPHARTHDLNVSPRPGHTETELLHRRVLDFVAHDRAASFVVFSLHR